MNRSRTLLLVIALTASACASKPDVQPPSPWYKTNPRLDTKAQEYLDQTKSLMNNQGLLLYRGFKPLTNNINYRDSHNMADAPAWHGAFMMSIALKMAVNESPDDEKLLSKLADGLLTYDQVTGVPGLMGRSYLVDYTGPRLDWMATKEERPTKYWRQGPRGHWWRTGLAKGHLSWAVMGAGLPLILHKQGEISLTKETQRKLQSITTAAVNRLVAGGFRYIDHDGSYTEFGDLRPDVSFGPEWPEIQGIPNGFNRALVLAMLACCRDNSPSLNTLYEIKSKEWAPGIGTSLEIVGEIVAKAGHWKLQKPSFSDMQLFGTACFIIMLQEDRREIRKGIHRGMRGLWEYMRYERNPLFTLPYALARRHEAAARAGDIIEDLRAFPLPKDKIAREFGKKDTDKVQPLANRTTNTHYWKSSPFRKARYVGKEIRHPSTNAIQYYSGQDYLVAYWLGRFLNLVPDK